MIDFVNGTIVKLKHFYRKLINKKIKKENDSSKVTNKWIIQKEEVIVFENKLENNFYNVNKSTIQNYPEVILYQLRDIYLVSKEAWPFVALDTIFNPAVQLYDNGQKKIKHPVDLLAREQREPIFHLAGPNSGNKGHFLIEHLPRLLSSIDILANFENYSLMLIPQRGKSHIPLLQKLGISPSRVIYASKGTIRCQELLYTPLLVNERKQYLAPPRIYIDIRNLVLKNTKIEKMERLAIFVSRTDAPDRFLNNEKEIFEFFQKYWPDLKLIRLSEYTLDEQINLFNNAKVVVGAHGQGFRNMLYANQCLGIQLHFGENFIHEWCSVYDTLACISGNHGITFYSGTNADHYGNWIFPKDLLECNMERLHSLLPSLFADNFLQF
jgi:hypothetical protein